MHQLILNKTIQPKLTIGQPGDKYEQEADAIADQVMKMPQSPPPIQRKSEDFEEGELQMKTVTPAISPIIQKREEEEEEILQMKGIGNKGESQRHLKSTLQQSKGNGQNLPETTQSFMNRSIGADFSKVKVHTDSNAVQMNQSLNAKAFAHGNNIYFNKGQYNPASENGKHLLAHELTHVVQQKNETKIQREPFEIESNTDHFQTVGEDDQEHPIGTRISKLGRIGARWLGTKKVKETKTFWWGEYEVEKEVDDDNYNVIKTLGKKIYAEPAGGGDYFRLKYNEMVQVIGNYKYDSKWLLVVGGSGKGWVPYQYVHYPVPDLQSELYYIHEGEMLKDVIANHYGGQGIDVRKWGDDVRLYVHAIAIINEAQGKKGLGYNKDNEDVSLFRELLLDKSGEESQRIWNSLYLKKGHNIWLPSNAIIQELKSQGLASAGSVSNTVVEFLKDYFLFQIGIQIGTFEGLWAAFVDVFAGIVDLFELAGTLIEKMINGELLDYFIEIYEGFIESISELDETAKKMWDEFMAKSAFDKGRAVGKIIGYIIFEVLVAFFTAGAVTAVKWAGKAGKLAKAFGKLGKVAAKSKKVKGKVKLPDANKQKVMKEAAEKRRAKPDTDVEKKPDNSKDHRESSNSTETNKTQSAPKKPVATKAEQDVINKYKADNPNTKFSEEELLDFQRKEYIYNENTKRFNKADSKSKKIDDYADHSKIDDLKQADIDPSIKTEMDKIKVERDKRKKERDTHEKGTDEYNKQNYEVIKRSGLLGEKAAEAYMKGKGAKRLYPPPDIKVEDWPSRSGVVDQVWELDGKLVVVEAKGGSSGLGSRKVGARRQQQGTPDYLEDIIGNMEKNPASKKLAEKMQVAFDDEAIEYLLVKQKLDKAGGLKDVEISKFNIFE